MEILNLDMTLGPLHYRLQAYDEWGANLLDRLTDHVDCRPFSGPAQRHVHIAKQPLEPITTEFFEAGVLPAELAALVSDTLPARGWQISGSSIRHITWLHADTHHVFWVESLEETAHPSPFQAPFHLPLDLVFHDIVQLGGGIVHGGLAVFQGRGVLLAAPPGGGKTTAFSTTPGHWQLEADDASLVWPTVDSTFLISPLPTWSVLLGVTPRLERIGQWRVAASWPLAGILLLEKSEVFTLGSQRPIDAAFPLYRAFSEYPTVILGRAPYRVTLFRAASTLARAVPVWSLQLPRKGNFWPRLEEELTHGGG